MPASPQIEKAMLMAMESWIVDEMIDKRDFDWHEIGQALRVVCIARGLSEHEGLVVMAGIVYECLQSKYDPKVLS